MYQVKVVFDDTSVTLGDKLRHKQPKKMRDGPSAHIADSCTCTCGTNAKSGGKRRN